MRTDTQPSIAFDDVGDSEPALLLLPGWCAQRNVFGPLLPHLEHRAIAVDWRGHGDSEAVAGDFGLNELVDDALAVIETAGVERVVPAATAHAGWVAIELRRRLGPKRVPGVALVDWMVLGAPPPFQQALTAMQQPESWRSVCAQLFERWTHGVSDRAVHDFVATMGDFEFDMWARAARAIGGAFEQCPVPLAKLDELACPTLHVYAQPTDDAFFRAQQEYAAAHPWFVVQKLDATSHFPSVEVPAQLAPHLDAFASKVGT